MLKTWYDLVQEARQAGISVSTKGAQLWNVGHGLPLDAIKRSRISAWKCQCEISDQGESLMIRTHATCCSLLTPDS